MTRKLFLFIAILSSLHTKAGNKIRYYFNHAVDNSVATGTNAIYLHNCTADTLAACINRAKYSIDIAQYDYNQGSFSNIAVAVNSAYVRGVQVRWIYDGSSSNTGLSLLNSGINTLGSPTSSHYGIMHNKYVVIDANSTDANDAVVFTGSFDWSTDQFNYDYNNAVIIQDSALAHAYTDEFNMMWGGTGLSPDLTLSKFGPDKTDLGRHSFTIDGQQIELYFSPSDGTNSHIQTAISSANSDLYFAMYTFTDNTDATMIVSKHNSGVYVAGINDSYSNSYSPHSTFTSGLGSNFIVYNGGDIYHNKFMVIDQADPCSDPQVLTGSHNWTTAANTQNDENTLIIHDAAAANIYYQSFHADFTSLGGTLTSVPGCMTSVQGVTPADEAVTIYPNPTTSDFTISYALTVAQPVTISVLNTLGQTVYASALNELQQAGQHNHTCSIKTPGLYLARITIDNNSYIRKIVVGAHQ